MKAMLKWLWCLTSGLKLFLLTYPRHLWGNVRPMNRPRINSKLVWRYLPPLWYQPMAINEISSPDASQPLLGEGGQLYGSLHHDCDAGQVIFCQMQQDITDVEKSTKALFKGAQFVTKTSPYIVQFDIGHFDGGYLSLVVDLPSEVQNGLCNTHIIGFSGAVDFKNPVDIFIRLNIKNGPNTHQITQKITPLPPIFSDRRFIAEFDLAYVNVNFHRLQSLWVDIVFETPQMNQIQLKDTVFTRYERARL